MLRRINIRITRIQTIHLAEHPNILLLQIETDEGLIGSADTYYATDAVRGYIHGVASPLLLGKNPLTIEKHWSTLYAASAHCGAKGAEMRGISAIDIALWDILGQAAGMPLYQVLGGACRESIAVYNTCAGPVYGRKLAGDSSGAGDDGRYEDLNAFLNRADELAHDLLSEGIKGMKIWPFDAYARTSQGLRIENSDLQKGMMPLRKIREAVGYDIEIMVEGHSFWSLPAACKIARALEEFSPAWLEDMMPADNVSALAQLRRSTSIPILASETLMTRFEYAELIAAEATDVVMVDPSWCGGITEARRCAVLADVAHLPVTFHDCTGPLTLLAGVHLALHAPNAMYQEIVRAFLRTFYRDLVTETVTLQDGHIVAPQSAGIGAALNPDVFKRADATFTESVH